MKRPRPRARRGEIGLVRLASGYWAIRWGRALARRTGVPLVESTQTRDRSEGVQILDRRRIEVFRTLADDDAANAVLRHVTPIPFEQLVSDFLREYRDGALPGRKPSSGTVDLCISHLLGARGGLLGFARSAKRALSSQFDAIVVTQGGVISPLLSNIYLHVLDTMWKRDGAQYGMLVRYADDFVVMTSTRKTCEQDVQRVRTILTRLGLELHPEKTRLAKLHDSEASFDFLGCHLHKRMSGPLWERSRKRLYFLNRWPSRRSMQRIRQRVKELTPRTRCHADIRDVIESLNPVLRGWGNYFRTGNAATCFTSIDAYVERRLQSLLVKRKGRHLVAGETRRSTPEYFEGFGIHRLRGTIKYPRNA